MVKITNGINVIEVTNGAFETVYKGQGYHKVVEQQAVVSAPVKSAPVKDEGQDTGEVDHVTELEEKPVSQWSKAEVKEYAEAKGIDLSGTKNVNEAKDRIKAAMSGSEE